MRKVYVPEHGNGSRLAVPHLLALPTTDHPITRSPPPASAAQGDDKFIFVGKAAWSSGITAEQALQVYKIHQPFGGILVGQALGVDTPSLVVPVEARARRESRGRFLWRAVHAAVCMRPPSRLSLLCVSFRGETARVVPGSGGGMVRGWVLLVGLLCLPTSVDGRARIPLSTKRCFARRSSFPSRPAAPNEPVEPIGSFNEG